MPYGRNDLLPKLNAELDRPHPIRLATGRPSFRPSVPLGQLAFPNIVLQRQLADLRYELPKIHRLYHLRAATILGSAFSRCRFQSVLWSECGSKFSYNSALVRTSLNCQSQSALDTALCVNRVPRQIITLCYQKLSFADPLSAYHFSRSFPPIFQSNLRATSPFVTPRLLLSVSSLRRVVQCPRRSARRGRGISEKAMRPQ